MRQQTKLQQITSAIAGLALIASASIGLAQNTNPTNTFDTSSSTASFVTWYGPPAPTMTWDGTLDAANDPASGSVRYEEAFTGTAGEQFQTFFTIANRWGWDGGYVLDATTYTNYSFDIKVDPSSGQRLSNNDYGPLEIGLVTSGWGTIGLPTYTIPLSATSWTHVARPLDGTLANIDKVVGFFFKMWSNGQHTNTLTFNIDNVMLTKPTVPVVIPPPRVNLQKAIPGLNLITTAASGQYGRQSIRTLNQGYSWVDRTGPVSYAINIKDAPTGSAGGFQTHIFLVPAAGAPYGSGDSAIDWNATNVFWLNIQGAGAQLMYKTNQGSGNAMFWNTNPTNGPVGTIATLAAPSPIGTWTLTFQDNTNITLTSPAGGTTNVSITPDAAALFADPLFAHFGAQPNDAANIGLSSTIKRISTTNTTDALDDSFPGPGLDSTTWGTAAADAAGIVVVPGDSAYWFSWTLPASSDSYVMSKSLLGGTWTDTGLANSILIGTHLQVLIPVSALPSAASGYFALGKRAYTKLQLLMPGETAAPGTPSGKAGTPDAQTTGVPFNVTVNAVDAAWHLVKGATNMVSITSSDITATLPADGALMTGTATFSVTFGTAGIWTVTATDVTDGTKTPNTGTPTTAN